MRKLIVIGMALTLALVAAEQAPAASGQSAVTTTKIGNAQASCKTVWAGRRRKNSLGLVVWRYRQEILFCYRRNRLVYVSRTRWGRTYLPCCWHFRGHIDSAITRNARWSYRAFTQGRFEYCGVGPVICVSSRTPWIRMTIYGNGTWTRKTG
jgi:hypothetical protein